MLKAIFLDIDNTLLDFDGYVKEALASGFEKFGLGTYEASVYETFSRINDSLWERIETGDLTFEGLKAIRFNLIFEALGITFDGPTFETYFREQLNVSAIPIEGAYDLLKALSQKYILCAASNGPYDQQCHRLELAGMSAYFSYVFISEEIGAGKPDRAFYERAFARLNRGREIPILPEECLAVGDSVTSDVAGGHAFGMKTCYYAHHKGNVTDDRIDLYAERLSDIPERIELWEMA